MFQLTNLSKVMVVFFSISVLSDLQRVLRTSGIPHGFYQPISAIFQTIISGTRDIVRVINRLVNLLDYLWFVSHTFRILDALPWKGLSHFRSTSHAPWTDEPRNVQLSWRPGSSAIRSRHGARKEGKNIDKTLLYYLVWIVGDKLHGYVVIRWYKLR